jgi:hypothetical protein
MTLAEAQGWRTCMLVCAAIGGVALVLARDMLFNNYPSPVVRVAIALIWIVYAGTSCFLLVAAWWIHQYIVTHRKHHCDP